MTKPIAATPAPPAAPLLCPLCRYNLTGLPDPRCPECGHTFEWADFTDPARQRLPWLVEHRRGPFGFFSTHLRLLRPWRFWRTLRPTHRLSAPRLLLYSATSHLTLFLLPPALLLAAITVALLQQPPAFRGHDPAPQEAWFYISLQFSQGRPLVMLVALITVFLALPLSLLILFAIMRQSSRRARIHWQHFLRVAVYALDPLPLLIVTTLALANIIFLPSSPNPYFLAPISRVADTLPSLLLLIIIAHLASLTRLHFALRHYLPFPRPWLITLTTAILALALIPAFSALVWPLILR